MKRLFTIYFILSLSISHAQDSDIIQPNQEVIPPSPTSAELGKYVDNPVSLYTGKPEINIPLWELNVRDYQLPIGLSYHAGGIKVEETPSNIGLGWVLNAGGVITRTVKGSPDDHKESFCPERYLTRGSQHEGEFRHLECKIGIFHSESEFNLRDINPIDQKNGTLFERYYRTPEVYTEDSEPDVFYFNFANMQGKFVFEVMDGVRTIHLLSHHDIEITHELDADGRLSSFQILDLSGNRYSFEAVEQSYDWSDNSYYDRIAFDYMPGRLSETTWNSSWYLTKIETPLGEEITLEYADELSSYMSSHLEERQYIRTIDQLTYNPNAQGPHPTVARSQTWLYGKRLVKIESGNTRIDVLGDREREDIWGYSETKDNVTYHRPRAITGLIISSKDYLGTYRRIKKWVFDQDYFESPPVAYFRLGAYEYRLDGTVYPDYPAVFNDHDQNMDVYFKRLRLSSVQEYGVSDADRLPPFTFDYKYDGYEGYDVEHRLPYRFSFQQDLWGYYNGASGNITAIPRLYVYPDMFNDSRRFSVYRRLNHTGREYILPGANRLPHVDLMDVGLLTKITYPTAGNTSYEYEPHRFQDGNEQFVGGGVRIKRITKHDGLSRLNDIVYNYAYENGDRSTSGKVISIPIYAYVSVDRGTARVDSIDTEEAFKYTTERFGLPQAPLGTTKGSIVGYRQVTEYMSGNGKTVYEYAMPALWHEINDSSDCTIEKNGSCDGLYELPTVHYFFPLGPLVPTGNQQPSDFVLDMSPATYNTRPFAESPNYDWNRGQLLTKRYYQESGALIAREVYNYDIWYPDGASAPGKVFGFKRVNIANPARVNPLTGMPRGNRPWGCWRVSKYHYLTDVAKVLTSKTVTEYVPETHNEISSTTTYQYHPLSHQMITKQTQETSGTDHLVTTYNYVLGEPFDSGDGREGLSALHSRKVLNKPYEISKYLQKDGRDYLQTSTLATYKLDQNLPVMSKFYQVELNQLLAGFVPAYVNFLTRTFSKDFRNKEQAEFTRYDDKGNILEVVDKITGLTTSYVWGYDQRFPVAQILNADYASIEAILTAEDFDDLNIGRAVSPIEVDILDREVRDIINKLRIGLPYAEVSSYTYKPLVGLTSETDPSNTTIFYEYDNFNRLKAIKDQDGHILEHFNYHYHGQ